MNINELNPEDFFDGVWIYGAAIVVCAVCFAWVPAEWAHKHKEWHKQEDLLIEG